MLVQNKLGNTGASLKLVEPENLHITLHFLGNIPEDSIDTLREIITNCCSDTTPFTVHLKGVGAFPSIKYPRVIWIGITDSNNIKQIVDCLRTELSKHGFRKEEKPFHAHVTIARVKRYSSQLKKQLQNLKEHTFGEINVAHIKLKKSTLTPRGPIYEDIFTIEI